MFHTGKSGKSYANPSAMKYEEGRMGGMSGMKKEPGDAPGDEGGDDVSAHLASMHEKMGGKHMHLHQRDDGGITSHQHSDMGPDGPHEHESPEALKAHLDDFLDGASDGGDTGMDMPHKVMKA